MRVVVIEGVFGDTAYLEDLPGAVDVIAYGSNARKAYYHTPEPPTCCPSRAFAPVGPRARGHQVWIFRGLRQALELDRPDVVHVVSEAWGTLPNQVVTWARREPGTAVVVHGADRVWWHGSAPEVLAKRLLARRVLRRTDGFAAQTERVIEVARDAGLPADVPTSVVHSHPRSPDLFQPPDDEGRRAARRRLGLPEEGVGVGFLARLAPEKGPLEFMDAVERAGTGLGGAWIAVAGAGPLEDPIRSRATDLGARFLGPLSFPERATDFYRAVDVFAVPSRRVGEWEDQSPRSVAEAMMSGCVVVGSTCGAIPEMIGDAGVVTAEGDIGALADGLVQAVAMTADYDLRSAARRRAIERYSPAATAEQLVDIWERALARRRDPA